MIARGLHSVFRIQQNSAAAFERFRQGDRDDVRIRITLGKAAYGYPGVAIMYCSRTTTGRRQAKRGRDPCLCRRI